MKSLQFIILVMIPLVMLTPDYDYYYDVDYKDDSQCRSSSWEPVCQGHGTCVQGMCKCDNDNTPKGRYYGQYCQCNDWSCPEEYEWSVEKNMIVPVRMCGGHGTCHCGACQCDSGWSGPTCMCSTDVEPCTSPNGWICSGRGQCICGKCFCSAEYAGDFCEHLKVYENFIEDDGVPSHCDEDDDNDGIPNDKDEDDDNDGIADEYDACDDGDGIPDVYEDDEKNGMKHGSCSDSDDDNDGIQVELNMDNDDDGIPDDEDDDNDGIPDELDMDDDNDGIPNGEDEDDDNDGIPDELDIDDDNDGIPDADNDGIPDTEDEDDDNDGIPDYIDEDDDNDGILDVEEYGGSLDGNSIGEDNYFRIDIILITSGVFAFTICL